MRFRLFSFLLLCLAPGCEAAERLEPPRPVSVRGADVKIVRSSPDEMEREARKLPQCMHAPVDSSWPVRTDVKQRGQWRLPARYRAYPLDSDSPDAATWSAWMDEDSSFVSLEFNSGTGGQSSFLGADDPVTMVDDGSCSTPFGGRIAMVLRLRAIGVRADTTYVALVSTDIRADFGLQAFIVTRNMIARDELLAAAASLQLKQ